MEVETSIVTAIERTVSPDITDPALGAATRWETVLTVRRERRTIAPAADMLLVPAGQPLGNLALYLLEPESDDGFARWGFLDASLKAGEPFPVYRLLNAPAARTLRE